MSSLPSTIRHTFAEGVAGWTLQDPAARRARWLGRDALMLGGGEAVLAPVAPEPPYTIRATVSGGPRECYTGFCFHVADLDNFETIYIAPHLGGQPAAIQYDPVIKGSTTWQVFADADSIAAASLERERWYLLRIDVWPDIAQVYVDDERAPKATFPLRSGRRAGLVGLWGYLPSYVADYEVQPLHGEPPPPPAPKTTVPSGTVGEWLVARYDEGAAAFTDPRLATAERNGTLCLNRLYSARPEARALAACDLEVPPDAQQVILEIGYSDRARVSWGGALVHEGVWRWDPPAGADGRIRPGQIKIPISGGPGRQLLAVEVAALEQGFGWGLTARAVADGSPCPWQTAERPPPQDLLGTRA